MFERFTDDKKPDAGTASSSLAGKVAQPLNIAAIMTQQEIMAVKLAAVGAVVDKQLERLTRGKRELEESSAAFQQHVTSIFAAAAAEKTQRSEEVFLWHQQGCPTTSAVTIMKPLKLSGHAGFTVMASL